MASILHSNEFVPPSEEIQKLFTFSNSKIGAANLNQVAQIYEHSFTEEEFSKMPTTLVKAIKRTNVLLLQTEIAKKHAIETNNELKSINASTSKVFLRISCCL